MQNFAAGEEPVTQESGSGITEAQRNKFRANMLEILGENCDADLKWFVSAFKLPEDMRKEEVMEILESYDDDTLGILIQKYIEAHFPQQEEN